MLAAVNLGGLIITPPNRVSLKPRHTLGTLVPVEEPATASRPDLRLLSRA